MQSSKLAVTLLVLVLIQCSLESGGWWLRRRRRRTKVKNNCPPPSGSKSDYFYGTTSLRLFKGKKREFHVFQWSLVHSLLLFRGKIFEWGLGHPKTFKMNRKSSQCSIRWSDGSKGTSRCLLSEAKDWTRKYPKKYGKYGWFTNNCHYFVNRLVKYLNTNCGH